MITQNKRFVKIILIVLFLLLIPFIAMFFTDEVKWNVKDFAIAAFLLFSAGLLMEWIIRKISSNFLRIFLCGAVLVILFLIWAELAVGVFGLPFGGH